MLVPSALFGDAMRAIFAREKYEKTQEKIKVNSKISRKLSCIFRFVHSLLMINFYSVYNRFDLNDSHSGFPLFPFLDFWWSFPLFDAQFEPWTRFAFTIAYRRCAIFKYVFFLKFMKSKYFSNHFFLLPILSLKRHTHISLMLFNKQDTFVFIFIFHIGFLQYIYEKM